MPHRLIKSIAGRRGSALTTLGFIFVPISLSQAISTTDTRATALQWLPEWITFSLIGWVFITLSAAVLLCGLFSRWLPAWCLSLGYGLAILPPAILSLIYAVALCLHPWMGGAVSFAIYTGYAALIYLISGWEEPRQSPPLTDEQRQLLGSER